MKNTITILAVLIFCYSCGAKKIDSNIKKEENISTELVDTTKTNTKTDEEKQINTTEIKEHIVTKYEVVFDTIPVDGGAPIIIPIVFPSQKEEFRDLSTSNFIWRLRTQDSIQNAVEQKYNHQIDEYEKVITKMNKGKKLRWFLYIIIAGLLLVSFVVLRFKK